MTKGAVLILGGRSDIGLATAHALAGAGHPVWLAARNAAGPVSYTHLTLPTN